VQQLDEVLGHAHDLQVAIAEAGTKIDQQQGVGQAALARLDHLVHDAEQRLQAALQGLQSEIDGLKQFATHSVDALTDGAREMIAWLSALCAEADKDAHDMLAAMTAKTSAHKETADNVYATLGGDLMGKVDEADGQVEQAVTTPVGDAEGHVRQELERMEATAAAQEQELARHGQALDAALQSMGGETQKVPVGVGHIQEAARQLGI
jgi:hypothetical protein